jgi:tRNA(Ile)-lysidine synthase
MKVKMLKKVQTYMQEYKMIAEEDRIVIGVSGGADSVCLFHVLLSLVPIYHLTLYVVHVNHGIRGEEADEDELFVKELCDRNQVAFFSVKADVPRIARLKGLSEEEAGRNVRYEAFFDCFKNNKCNKIAIAHNRNDSAETILFNLFRGSGIKGLTGIRPIREEIIRPLLCVSRNDIEDYLKQHQISYRTDRTNLSEDYSRNKIRHHIINFAQEEINSGTIAHIVNTAKQLEEINEYLEKSVRKAYENTVLYKEAEKSYVIDIERLKQEDIVIQKGIIRTVFNRLANQLKDVEAQHVDFVLALQEKEVGKRLNLPYGILAVKGYHDITMYIPLRDSGPQSGKVEEIKISELEIQPPGDYYLPQIDKMLRVKVFNYKKSMIIPQNGCTKWFDYDKIENTVLVRTRREGDFIQIDSNGNRKKMKSLFIDDKVPRERRNLLPLLADGEHIMWVIGGRMSEAYKVSAETKVILEISLDGGKKDGRQN